MLAFSLLFALCIVSSVITSSFYPLIVHETLDAVPSGFSIVGQVTSDSLLNLQLVLTPRDIGGLKDVFEAVSTPGSNRYGKHLSQEEVAMFVKPSNLSTRLVIDWLTSHHVDSKSISFSRSVLQVSLTITKANEILGTNFEVFREDATGKEAIRTLGYSIPATLKGHLEYIHPTINFPVTTAWPHVRVTAATPTNSTRSDGLTACHEIITPTCIQNLYGVPAIPTTQFNNKFFVSGLSGQYANKNDLKAFLMANRPDLSPNTSFSLLSVANGTNSQNTSNSGIEATLDIQYAVGVATDVPITFVSVGPADVETDKEFWVAIHNELNYLLTMDNPPTTLSTSYALDENTISRPLASTICNLYMQLGARGVSVIVASGDGGVSGAQLRACNGEAFMPTFPSTCPYVTSVGATQLDKFRDKEKGADFGFGYSPSGGFSRHFATPSYQLTQISSFVQSLRSTYAGLYNTTGRGFPDVSALGVNLTIVWQGEATLINGTSAATPTFSAIVALVNGRLLAAGKSGLGFLNPLLYSAQGTAAFTDITSGHNPGCGTKGFSARVGWDPMTGLGTPIFSKLLEAAGV